MGGIPYGLHAGWFIWVGEEDNERTYLDVEVRGGYLEVGQSSPEKDLVNCWDTSIYLFAQPVNDVKIEAGSALVGRKRILFGDGSICVYWVPPPADENSIQLGMGYRRFRYSVLDGEGERAVSPNEEGIFFQGWFTPFRGEELLNRFAEPSNFRLGYCASLWETPFPGRFMLEINLASEEGAGLQLHLFWQQEKMGQEKQWRFGGSLRITYLHNLL